MRNAVNTWTTAIATPYDYEMLEDDTLEHVAYGDGTNVLGPGGC